MDRQTKFSIIKLNSFWKITYCCITINKYDMKGLIKIVNEHCCFFFQSLFLLNMLAPFMTELYKLCCEL